MSKHNFDKHDHYDDIDDYQDLSDPKSKVKKKKIQAANRRRVEDILEEKRMKEELDDLEFYLKGGDEYYDDL